MGYTNNKNPITDFPLVLFGDHTCIFKYIDFNEVLTDSSGFLKRE